MTQASSVIPVVSCNDAEFGTVTYVFVPLNTRAFPNRPAVVHAAPTIVPVRKFPDESPTVGPEPSLKEYAATRPGTAVLARVTTTPADTILFPAASRARAVSVCCPFATPAVFHVTEYGAVVSSAPSGAPSTRNCTPATAMLSEAFAVTVTDPDTVAPPAGAVIETVGALVSYVTVSVLVPGLPAASFAVTVTTFVPGCRTIPLADQLVVPVAVPLPPRSLAQVTCVTPTLSAAVPPTVSGLLPVL